MKQYRSFQAIQEAIQKNEISCNSLVSYYVDTIEKNKHLNVFTEVYADEALSRASEIDQKIKLGKAGKLAGMVVGIKDVLCLEGHHLYAGSKILEGFESQFTATAVQRLLDEDAIIIGRQNCDEFAMGSSSENCAYGPVRNAKDPNRVPGGSSGGSAVAVQADMCLISLGTDTGGSVRQPAAFCGVIGFKPTYSRISRYGLAAYASSFDTVGIFSHSIEDNALVLEVIAGPDDYDSTVYHGDVPQYTAKMGLEGKLKIAYLKEALESEGLNEEVKKATLASIARLKAEGHTVEQVDFPLLDYLLPTYYILTTAEASSNLSRYDGVKYGYRSPKASNLESMYKLTRTQGFGEEAKRRILLGTFVLSASYYDAYYTKAQKVRRMIKESTEKLLEDYDFILSPTTPTTAFKIGEKSKDPLAMYLADIYTVQASVAGLPAISIPNGEDSEGLPIGLQLIASPFEEHRLFALSRHLLNQ